MILIQLANALSARGDSDMALERERLLDRHGGKAVSRTELTGKGGAPLRVNVVTGVNHDVIEGIVARVTEVDSED